MLLRWLKIRDSYMTATVQFSAFRHFEYHLGSHTSAPGRLMLARCKLQQMFGNYYIPLRKTTSYD